MDVIHCYLIKMTIPVHHSPFMQGNRPGTRLPQGARSLASWRSRALGTRRCFHNDLWHWYSVLPVRRPVLPDPGRRMGLLQCPDEHNERLSRDPDAQLPSERWVGHLQDEGPVDGERASLLSRYAVPVRRVHPLPAPEARILRHQHHPAVFSAQRTRHDRLLSATWRRREDLTWNLRAPRLHRISTHGRREHTTHVATRAHNRYERDSITFLEILSVFSNLS